MELIRGLYSLQPRHRSCVATIGNFDGVHRGHQAVVRQLARRAAELSLPSTLITFEPLPQEFFLRENAPARLTRLREKLTALDHLGVDRVLCLPFNRRLAERSAEEFIEQVLVDGLGVRHLVVGDDFRFGKGRTGDFHLLADAGARYGFAVERTETFICDGGERVSSTRIREALASGDLDLAEHLLGRPYVTSGRVIHGDKRGRQLGFPTANLRGGQRVSPLKGVFAVEVGGLTEHWLPAVCNVGTRPSVDGRSFLIEIHLLDFSGDLYGRRLEVRWRQRLRAERRFESLEALKAQIALDTAQARHYFEQTSP